MNHSPVNVEKLMVATEGSSSLMGSSAKGSLRNVCGHSAKISLKFAEMRFIASGKGPEILWKVCGNFSESCGNLSAMTPSRTTP